MTDDSSWADFSNAKNDSSSWADFGSFDGSSNNELGNANAFSFPDSFTTSQGISQAFQTQPEDSHFASFGKDHVNPQSKQSNGNEITEQSRTPNPQDFLISQNSETSTANGMDDFVEEDDSHRKLGGFDDNDSDYEEDDDEFFKLKPLDVPAPPADFELPKQSTLVMEGEHEEKAEEMLEDTLQRSEQSEQKIDEPEANFIADSLKNTHIHVESQSNEIFMDTKEATIKVESSQDLENLGNATTAFHDGDSSFGNGSASGANNEGSVDWNAAFPDSSTVSDANWTAFPSATNSTFESSFDSNNNDANNIERTDVLQLKDPMHEEATVETSEPNLGISNQFVGGTSSIISVETVDTLGNSNLMHPNLSETPVDLVPKEEEQPQNENEIQPEIEQPPSTVTPPSTQVQFIPPDIEVNESEEEQEPQESDGKETKELTGTDSAVETVTSLNGHIEHTHSDFNENTSHIDEDNGNKKEEDDFSNKQQHQLNQLQQQQDSSSQDQIGFTSSSDSSTTDTHLWAATGDWDAFPSSTTSTGDAHLSFTNTSIDSTNCNTNDTLKESSEGEETFDDHKKPELKTEGSSDDLNGDDSSFFEKSNQKTSADSISQQSSTIATITQTPATQFVKQSDDFSNFDDWGSGDDNDNVDGNNNFNDDDGDFSAFDNFGNTNTGNFDFPETSSKTSTASSTIQQNNASIQQTQQTPTPTTLSNPSMFDGNPEEVKSRLVQLLSSLLPSEAATLDYESFNSLESIAGEVLLNKRWQPRDSKQAPKPAFRGTTFETDFLDAIGKQPIPITPIMSTSFSFTPRKQFGSATKGPLVAKPITEITPVPLDPAFVAAALGGLDVNGNIQQSSNGTYTPSAVLAPTGPTLQLQLVSPDSGFPTLSRTGASTSTVDPIPISNIPMDFSIFDSPAPIATSTSTAGATNSGNSNSVAIEQADSSWMMAFMSSSNATPSGSSTAPLTATVANGTSSNPMAAFSATPSQKSTETQRTGPMTPSTFNNVGNSTIISPVPSLAYRKSSTRSFFLQDPSTDPNNISTTTIQHTATATTSENQSPPLHSTNASPGPKTITFSRSNSKTSLPSGTYDDVSSNVQEPERTFEPNDKVGPVVWNLLKSMPNIEFMLSSTINLKQK